MRKTVAVSPPLRQDVGRVSYHVDVQRAAIATLAHVSEVVSVKMVIPRTTRGTGLRARKVRVCGTVI